MNIGSIISYASQAESFSPAAQAYLWCISKLNMSTYIQRSIIARRTPMPVKMIMVTISKYSRLKCGMPVCIAIRKYDVCKMMSNVLAGTYVYIRRKHGSPSDYQMVALWNSDNRYASTVESLHDQEMRVSFEREQLVRKNVEYACRPELFEEECENIMEANADVLQIQAMNMRKI